MNKTIVMLEIIEHICYDDNPIHDTYILETEDLEHFEENIKASYMEHLKSNGYKTIEEGKEEGFYFGNQFRDMLPLLAEKYGIKPVYHADFCADFDNIWDW